jgi:hypothetical protein
MGTELSKVAVAPTALELSSYFFLRERDDLCKMTHQFFSAADERSDY